MTEEEKRELLAKINDSTALMLTHITYIAGSDVDLIEKQLYITRELTDKLGIPSAAPSEVALAFVEKLKNKEIDTND